MFIVFHIHFSKFYKLLASCLTYRYNIVMIFSVDFTRAVKLTYWNSLSLQFISLSFSRVSLHATWTATTRHSVGGAHLRISVWHLLMNLKNNSLLNNCWSGTIKNVRILIFTLLYFFKTNKEKHLEISLFYTCVPKILMICSTVFEI